MNTIIDFFVANKEWLFSGLGISVIIFLYSQLKHIPQSIKEYKQTKNNSLVGIYEGYRFIPSDNGQITCIAVQIKWSIIYGYRFRVRHPKYKFKGSIKLRNSNLYFTFFGSQKILGIWIFSRPLQRFNSILGITCGTSLIGEPSAGKMLLVRSKLNDINDIKTGRVTIRKKLNTLNRVLKLDSERRLNTYRNQDIFINL